MYAAKMDAEGAAMYDAAAALRDAMIELGLACDGGKDSLSMAAGALLLSTHAIYHVYIRIFLCEWMYTNVRAFDI